ncbi:type III secretion protein [Sphingomonas sp. Leaf412]|uniref:type III secretion system export apparatus subunit SctU n=1 Tax=Sphingomonas sp. Leaf412 TaxID=1736370 RepID=UPI0006FD827C|nr:type III secretion system export apparatus subunit SctU [Sphingomonas sp. Leaf412]KQT35014.1 type III secretion protein [Sphingomonas sp. Leaf412]
MAGKNDGGDKTEKPTPKRLADARRKGDVAKSKDVTATVTLFVWLVVFIFGAGFAGARIAALFQESFHLVAAGGSFAVAASGLGWNALWALLAICAVALIPAAVAGTLVEFLQGGGVFTTEKMKPSLEKLNPVEGLKKMFSLDNVVELLKTLAKAMLIVFVIWLILKGSLGEIVERTGPLLQPAAQSDGRAAAASVLGYTGALVRQALLWTFAVFVVVAVLDLAWQKHSFMKKMRMSMRDIRQEHKDNEGDPMIKGNRRQLHEEWANQNAVGAARGANVLVVNPTHIAIAIDYDPDGAPVPVVAAKGEGPLAQAMREAAEEAGVPIVRHVAVARKLYEDAVVEDIVPRDMFEAIAQIILWAKKVRSGEAPQHHDLGADRRLETS